MARNLSILIIKHKSLNLSNISNDKSQYLLLFNKDFTINTSNLSIELHFNIGMQSVPLLYFYLSMIGNVTKISKKAYNIEVSKLFILKYDLFFNF